MLPPPRRSPTDDDEHHSRIHYHLGTIIGFAELVFFATEAFIASLGLTALFYHILVEKYELKPASQAIAYFVIAVCLYVVSRPVIWLMKAGHKAIERWEAHARELLTRGEHLPWLQDKLLVGLELLKSVPHERPRVHDIYLVQQPHPMPQKHRSPEPSTSIEIEEEEDEGSQTGLTGIVSVQDVAVNMSGKKKPSSSHAEEKKQKKKAEAEARRGDRF